MIRAYLRHSRRVIALCTAMYILLGAVCVLYGLPLEALLYCGLMTLFLLAVAGTVGYVRFRSRALELELLQKRMQENLPLLPPPVDRLEEDYQELLRLLAADRTQRTMRAEQAHREMMEYYTLWAHQVKTPLAALRLLLQSPAGVNVDEMEGELIQVERYVDMVLSYLRLDSESSDFVFARQPLDPIVRGAVRKLARLFILKHLILELPALELSVLTDRKWLGFVLEQLLTNAIKYTPEGGKISLTLEGYTLVLADTGVGIRPEDLPRIFEKGYTGYNGREEQRSTGLGLYLCRRVMDQLGHGLHITSVQGEGTHVELTFSADAPVYE